MISESTIELFRARLEGRVDTDVPLARYTTYRLGGPARLFVEPARADDIEVLATILSELAEAPPILVVGRGSNLVISDLGWPGLAVRLGAAFSFVEDTESGLRAGGVTALPLLANRAARRGLAGVEFTVAIPGSVGGAVRMNAGAHGREVKDCLVAATICDLGGGGSINRTVADLEMSYRHSNLSDDHLVLDATFTLEPASAAEVRERMESYRAHRAATSRTSTGGGSSTPPAWSASASCGLKRPEPAAT